MKKTLLPSCQEHGGHWTVFPISPLGIGFLQTAWPTCHPSVIQSLNSCWNTKAWPSQHKWGQSKKTILGLSNGIGWDFLRNLLQYKFSLCCLLVSSLPFHRCGIPGNSLINIIHASFISESVSYKNPTYNKSYGFKRVR